jgi:hypothetical protein
MKTKRRQRRQRRNNTKYGKRGGLFGFNFFGEKKVEPQKVADWDGEFEKDGEFKNDEDITEYNRSLPTNKKNSQNSYQRLYLENRATKFEEIYRQITSYFNQNSCSEECIMNTCNAVSRRIKTKEEKQEFIEYLESKKESFRSESTIKNKTDTEKTFLEKKMADINILLPIIKKCKYNFNEWIPSLNLNTTFSDEEVKIFSDILLEPARNICNKFNQSLAQDRNARKKFFKFLDARISSCKPPCTKTQLEKLQRQLKYLPACSSDTYFSKSSNEALIEAIRREENAQGGTKRKTKRHRKNKRKTRRG